MERAFNNIHIALLRPHKFSMLQNTQRNRFYDDVLKYCDGMPPKCNDFIKRARRQYNYFAVYTMVSALNDYLQFYFSCRVAVEQHPRALVVVPLAHLRVELQSLKTKRKNCG